MFDYLQKFNKLPADLRAKVSSPSVMATITELENKYRVDLAAVVMKVMIRSVKLSDLSTFFITKFHLQAPVAAKLVVELKTRVLVVVADYLGLDAKPQAWDLERNLDSIIKKAEIVLPSSVLRHRFQNILQIYIKGIRNKIDTRNTLAKNIKIGGLNLSNHEIEQVLEICDQQLSISHQSDINHQSPNSNNRPSSNLTKTGNISSPQANISNSLTSTSLSSPEYNLKQALQERQTDNLEISAPKPQLDLPPLKPILKLATQDTGMKLESKSLKSSTPTPTSTLIPKINSQPNKQQHQIPKDSDQKIMEATSPLQQNSSPNLKIFKDQHGVALAPLKSKTKSAPPVPESSTTPLARSFKKPKFWSKFTLFKNNSKENKKSLIESKEIATVSKSSPVKPSSTPKPPKSVSPTSSPTKSEGSLSNKAVFQAPSPPSSSVSPIPPTPPPPPPSISSGLNKIIPTDSITPNNSSSVSSKKLSPRPAPIPASARPVMQDIKSIPKVMGPIEELQYLNLLNFRRLGKDPQEITDKILAKIKLLEKDGYDKMVAGVLAWRQSPVNRLYLRLGREALNKDLSLQDYLNSLSKDHQKYLTYKEVLALVDLNSKLVF